MSVKETAKRLYRRIIDGAGDSFADHNNPNEGWLMTMRKSLGMSGPQLAKRAGVTKAAIYQAERKEMAGEITIKQLEKLASAMGGSLVYAIVPAFDERPRPGTKTKSPRIADLIHKQARRKAEAVVSSTNVHMALEQQALSKEANEAEIERLAEKLQRDPPPDFWDGP